MKKIFNYIFIIIILLAVAVLMYAYIDTMSKKSDSKDYTIEDTTEVCAQSLEEIYRTNDYIYYLPCVKSDNLYLIWVDGTKTKMIDDLNSGKVSIESLQKHGLKVYKYENES